MSLKFTKISFFWELYIQFWGQNLDNAKINVLFSEGGNVCISVYFIQQSFTELYNV